jgi:hypothetical protein
MPRAKFAHEGANIDCTPTSAVAVGDVIVTATATDNKEASGFR